MQRRHLIVLLAWAVSLFALSRHEPQPAPSEAPSQVAEYAGDDAEDNWWGIFLQGRKVGFTHLRLIRHPDTLEFRQESVLKLSTLGEKQTVRAVASGHMSNAFALQSVTFDLTTGPSQFHLAANREDNKLRVRSTPSGHSFEVPGTVYFSAGLRAGAMKPPLEVGRVVRGPVFDPLTRTTAALELEVIERAPLPGDPKQTVWRIREKWREVESVLWVSEGGELLREEGPMGLVAVRQTAGDAQALVDEDWDAVDAVSLRVSPVENPRRRASLRVRLSGWPLDQIPHGGGQIIEGADIVINRLRSDDWETYHLPYQRRDRSAELASTQTIQADHPRLVSLTEVILEDESDALAATRLLVDWVHRYLKKVPMASLPDALQVLDIGSGDCTEHAVLLTALARAAGLPARLATGLVYGEGAFLYHAWTEVWLGQWVPVDAALNQIPADATHVRLIEGDDLTALMGMIGNLSIAVVEDAALQPAAAHASLPTPSS